MSVLHEEDIYRHRYQKLTAANFGPGKAAIGLNHTRYTAWATTYTSQAAKITISADETESLLSGTKSIVYCISSVGAEILARCAGQEGKRDTARVEAQIC
jgi:homoserine kinase